MTGVLDRLHALAWYLVIDPIEYPSGQLRPTKHSREQHCAKEIVSIIELVRTNAQDQG